MTRIKTIYIVSLSKQAQKDFKKLPLHVAIKLQSWIDEVGNRGLHEIRKVKGYHDEPLKGDRNGQRSIRLNRAYRAIYVIRDNNIEFIEILEITKHVY